MQASQAFVQRTKCGAERTAPKHPILRRRSTVRAPNHVHVQRATYTAFGRHNAPHTSRREPCMTQLAQRDVALSFTEYHGDPQRR